MRRQHPPSLHKTVLSVPAWRCRCWWRKPRRDWFFEHCRPWLLCQDETWLLATKTNGAMKEDQKSDPFGKVRQLPKVDHWSVLEKMKRSTRRFASAMKHCHQKRGVLDVFNPPEKSESHAGPSHFHGENSPPSALPEACWSVATATWASIFFVSQTEDCWPRKRLVTLDIEDLKPPILRGEYSIWNYPFFRGTYNFESFPIRKMILKWLISGRCRR